MPITQVITALPPVPDPAIHDKDTYAQKASAFTVAIASMAAELNTLATQANLLAAALNAGPSFAIDYTFSTQTAAADPGAGFMRLNNATQNLATAMYLDVLSTNGADWTNAINLFDDSTSTVKGYLMLRKGDDATKFIVFAVTALALPSGYRNVTVSVAASSSANPFADGDAVTLSFSRTGDKGDTGATGPTTPAQVQDQTYTAFTTAGTGTAYTLTPSPAISAYTANKSFFVTFHAASGASPTLAISGVATPPNLVKQSGSGTYTNIAALDIPANHRSQVTLLSATQALVETLPSAAPDEVQDQTFLAFTTAGTSTAYTLTPSPAITAYAAGKSFFVTFNAACGASPTLQISGVATPPNLVKQLPDGTYANIAAGDIPINHRSRVTLLSATQALVERLPDGSLIGVQVFTAGGTYTPTAGTKSVVVEVQGGGGAGGGSVATGAGQLSVGSGGTSGAYGCSRLTSGFSGITVTIGAGGTGVSGAAGNGGGTSSFGALISAPGGAGGAAGAATAPPFVSSTGAAPVATGGNVTNDVGGAGGLGLAASTASAVSGVGGASHFGGGANSTGLGNGIAASSKGAGGSGAVTGSSGAAATGGNGAPGLVVVWEYA